MTQSRFITLLATAFAAPALTSPAFAVDIITIRGAARRASGKITSISKTAVVIKKTGEKAQTVNVNDIVRINWDREPKKVEGLRNAEAAGRLQQALDGFKAMLSDPKVTHENLRKDLTYFVARTTAKLARTETGNADDAIAKLEAFRKSNGMSYHYYDLLMQLGRVFQAKKDYQQAVSTFRLWGQAPWPEFQLGARNAEAGVLLDQSQAPAALAIYTDVLGKAGNAAEMKLIVADATLGKAACLQLTGKNSEAIGVLNDIIDSAPKGDNRMLAGAYALKGDCHLALNQKKDALLSFLHVDVLFENQREYHPRALYHLSKLWAEAGKFDRAEAAKLKLVGVYPKSEWAKKK